jgi:adenine-specific DNA methylase
VVTTRPGEQGRFYRLPSERDLDIVRKSVDELGRRKAAHTGLLSLVPDEEISLNEIRRISVPLYGITSWKDLFGTRQALSLVCFAGLMRSENVQAKGATEQDSAQAVQTCLALAIDRQADHTNSCCTWNPSAVAAKAIGVV